MKQTIKDYELELIDDPLQSHVIAWEKTTRALKTEDAKPLLDEMQDAFHGVKLDADPSEVIACFVNAAKLLSKAIKIISENETLTSTANHGVMVKAAMRAGWIVSFTKAGQSVLANEADVDNQKPWLMTWVAEHVARLYLEATNIPKN